MITVTGADPVAVSHCGPSQRSIKTPIEQLYNNKATCAHVIWTINIKSLGL